MNERPFNRNLFLTLFSDSCSDLEREELNHLSTSVALEFFSKMKTMDQQEYSYLRSLQTINFTRDETIFQESINSLYLKETCLASTEQITHFLYNPKNLDLGHSYYFWVFSDIPQNRIIELLKPLFCYKAQIFILRNREIAEHRFFHGVHFFQPSNLNLNEKTERLVQLIGESFFKPYSVLIRVGQLEQFTWMSVSPKYSHTIDVLDIVGFSPLKDLVISGLTSEHVLIDYDETDNDNSIIHALKANLQQNALYAVAQCGSAGRFALILPSSTSLILLLLDQGTFLLNPWTTELLGFRQESCYKNNPGFWEHTDVNPVFSNHPSAIIDAILKSLANLAENLPVLIERLEYVWKSGVICLNDSKKNSIKFSLVHSQRMAKVKNDEILELRLKLALKILNQIKIVSELHDSSIHKFIVNRGPHQLYQPPVDHDIVENNCLLGVQPHYEKPDLTEKDGSNSEKWVFCESIDSLISSSKSRSKKNISDFSPTEYSPKDHNFSPFYEKESSPSPTDPPHSIAPSISEPEESTSYQKNDFLNCLSVSPEQDDSKNDEFHTSNLSLSSKKPSYQSKSSPKSNLGSSGKSESLKYIGMKGSYPTQTAEKTIESFDIQNTPMGFLHDDITYIKPNHSKATPSYCLAPGLTSYLRMKHEAFNRTSSSLFKNVIEPLDKADSSKYPSTVRLPGVSIMDEFYSSEVDSHPKRKCLGKKRDENPADLPHVPAVVSKEVPSETSSNDSAPGSQIPNDKPFNSSEFYKSLDFNFYHIDYTEGLKSLSPNEKSANHLEFTQDDYTLLLDAKNNLVSKNKPCIIPMEAIPESSSLQVNNTSTQSPGCLKRILETSDLEFDTLDFSFKNPNASFSHFCEDKGTIACQSPEIASNFQEFSESNLSSTDSSDISKGSRNDSSFISRRIPNKIDGYGYYKPREHYFQKNGSFGTSKPYQIQQQHKYQYGYTNSFKRFDLSPNFAPANRSNFKEYNKQGISTRYNYGYPAKRYPASFDETKGFDYMSKKHQHPTHPSKLYDYRETPRPQFINSTKKGNHSYGSHPNQFGDSHSSYDPFDSIYKSSSGKDLDY